MISENREIPGGALLLLLLVVYFARTTQVKVFSASRLLRGGTIVGVKVAYAPY